MSGDNWYAEYRQEVEAPYEVVGDLCYGVPATHLWSFNRWMGSATVSKNGELVAYLRGRGDPVGLVIVTSDGELFRELLLPSKNEAMRLLKKLGPLPSNEAVQRAWTARGGDDLYD